MAIKFTYNCHRIERHNFLGSHYDSYRSRPGARGLQKLHRCLRRHQPTHRAQNRAYVPRGLKLDETACDLPVCIALASSLLDLPVDEKTIAIGEVGLGGEVRSVTHLETRLREAQRVGFDTAIVPKHNLKMIDPSQFPGLKLVGVSYLREAINAIKLK